MWRGSKGQEWLYYYGLTVAYVKGGFRVEEKKGPTAGKFYLMNLFMINKIAIAVYAISDSVVNHAAKQIIVTHSDYK